MTNVTGWEELMNASIVDAVYVMFNESLYGNLIMLLWMTLSAVLYMKTKNIGLTFFLGILSFSVFYGMLTPLSINIMTLVLIIELGIALYQIFWKR